MVPHELQLVRIRSEQLALVAPVFDAYRQFYGAPPDLEGARQFLSERLHRNESVVFAVASGRALGFAQLYPSFSSVSMKPIWILNDIFVVQKARGLGIGSRLLMAARDHAVQTGAVRLVLATAVENVSAQAVYERRGWQKDVNFLHYRLEIAEGPHDPPKRRR